MIDGSRGFLVGAGFVEDLGVGTKGFDLMSYPSFDKWKSRWVSSLIEVFIMYLTNRKERFGGELVKLSQKYIDPSAKVPTIYAILKRLSDAGFLREKSISHEIGITRGKSRIYYESTSDGAKYFHLLQNQIESSQIPCELQEFLMAEDEL